MHTTPHLHPCRTAPLLLLAGLLGGCSATALLSGRFEDPEIALSESKVESLSPAAADVSFGLNVSNPNSYGLRVRKVRYRLTVGGSVVAEGTADAGASISAHGSSTVTVPTSIALTALVDAAPSAVMLGEIPYQLEAWLSVGTILLQREVAFVGESAFRINLPLGLALRAALPAQAAAGCGRESTPVRGTLDIKCPAGVSNLHGIQSR